MPLIAIGGSIIGGLLASHGASKAAQSQQQAAQQAQQTIAQNAERGVGIESGALQSETQNLQPYMTAGTTALSSLSGMQPFTAPTAEQAAATPGYQFQLTQGLKALQNSAAARGGLLSGGTAKAINDYAQGQAASNYGNVYNRALQTYQTNRNNLMSLADLGAGTAGQLSGLEQTNANSQAGILGQSAAEQAQQINNAGAARASGYAQQGNIWGNVAGGIGGTLSGLTSLNQLNPFRNSGGGNPNISGWNATVPVPPGYVYS